MCWAVTASPPPSRSTGCGRCATRTPSASTTMTAARSEPVGSRESAGSRRGVEVGALSVVVEDDEDLCRTAVCLDGVGDHGGELGGLAGLDSYGALAEDQRDGSRQDGEPFLAGVHSELIGHRSVRFLGCADLGATGSGWR